MKPMISVSPCGSRDVFRDSVACMVMWVIWVAQHGTASPLGLILTPGLMTLLSWPIASMHIDLVWFPTPPLCSPFATPWLRLILLLTQPSLLIRSTSDCLDQCFHCQWWYMGFSSASPLEMFHFLYMYCLMTCSLHSLHAPSVLHLVMCRELYQYGQLLDTVFGGLLSCAYSPRVETAQWPSLYATASPATNIPFDLWKSWISLWFHDSLSTNFMMWWINYFDWCAIPVFPVFSNEEIPPVSTPQQI